MSEKEIMVLGDEAAAWGAIDAGVKGVFAYPGTPSTEIFEGAERIIHKLDDGRSAKIGANEKVAYEFALGASYAGCRTMVTMKHVGLNVAMDAFVNNGMTGVHGGLVVAVADDPSMHSSQNEQDSRYLADFAHIPCLEPSTPQEVYDMTREAFEISEKFKLPVMLRLVTRLAHGRGQVRRKEMKPIVELGVPTGDDKKNWVLIPANARVQNRKLRAKLPEMLSWSAEHNMIRMGSKRVGVITAGMGRSYFNQMKRYDPSLEEMNCLEVETYPVDKHLLRAFLTQNDEIFVLEENYPYLEDQLLDLTRETTIHGRRDETLPIDGELTMLSTRKALGLSVTEGTKMPNMDIPIRPPKLCTGCGHVDAFKALQEAFANAGVKDPRVFGDIGCYTLGFLPPYNSIQSCVEMGASVGMTVGASYVGHDHSVGVIGDSTFFHSGLPTLVSMAKMDTNATLIIMDNRITAMTGQQETVAVDIIPNIVKSVGFSEEQIHILTPLPKHHETNVKEMEKVLNHNGPDVVIFRRECIEALRKGLYKKIDQKK